MRRTTINSLHAGSSWDLVTVAFDFLHFVSGARLCREKCQDVRIQRFDLCGSKAKVILRGHKSVPA